MVCLGSKQRSFCHFWDCIQIVHFTLFCWLWWLLHFFNTFKVPQWHLMRRVDSLEKTLMLGRIEGRRRRGWQRMRWLDGITDSMDVSLSELRELVMDRDAIHGVGKSRTQLSNWTELNWMFFHFLRVHFLFALNSIPLFVYITLYLSTYLLKNILIASKNLASINKAALI